MNEADAVMPELDKPLVEIERAEPENAEVICDIRDRAWLETYPNDKLGITREDILLMAKGPNSEYVPRRIAFLKEQFAKNDGTGTGTFVAKVESQVVGYTTLDIDELGRRRIGAMYVAPEAQGSGVGGKLMKQALDALGRYGDIYLEVVSYNGKAIGFYEHFGFEKTDEAVPEEEGRPDYLKKLPQTEMVLRAA